MKVGTLIVGDQREVLIRVRLAFGRGDGVKTKEVRESVKLRPEIPGGQSPATLHLHILEIRNDGTPTHLL